MNTSCCLAKRGAKAILSTPFLQIFALLARLSAGQIQWSASGGEGRSLLQRTIFGVQIRKNTRKNTFQTNPPARCTTLDSSHTRLENSFFQFQSVSRLVDEPPTELKY